MRVVALLAVVIVSGASCEASTRGATVPSGAQVEYSLPFGLQPVAGTSAVARPAVYDLVGLEFEGQPVKMSTLRAAYVVNGDDPVAVFREWVNQLQTLPLADVSVRPGSAEVGQWLQAQAFGDFRADEPPAGSADLQLWVTEDAPVLLVNISLRPGAEATGSASPPGWSAPPRPTAEVESGTARTGDVLFTEQGADVHLPEGSRALMPTLPTAAGTGGSTSVLAADDGEAAVQAVLSEAQPLSDFGEVQGPTVSDRDGMQVVTASFNISAGGWGFHAVSVRGSEDENASVYITSAAD